MTEFLNMNDRVKDKQGRQGTIVPIPHDYGHAPGDDQFTQARLVYVQFEGDDEAILVPESRLKKVEELQEVDEDFDPCPDCGEPLKDAPGGGVKCPECHYWFCY